MNRKIKYSIAALFAAIVIGGIVYLNSLMPIITGYAAKNLGSAVFVSERSQKDVEALDLNFSFIRFTKNSVDEVNKTVTSRFLWGKSVAVYREGYGCTLLPDKKQPQNNLPKLQTAYNPDTIAWPMGNILPEFDTGADLSKLSEIKENLIEKGRYGGHTFAFVVLYKGVPVMEGYNSGINRDTRLLSWSVAKSFTNALVGTMVKANQIDLHASTGLEIWKNDNRRDITVDDLLRMQSGLKWNENYGNRSDVTVMLHCKNDFAEYAADRPLQSPTGEEWYYSSGSTNIINKVMRKKFSNDDDYYRYAKEQLFDRIGMPRAVFEIDAAGNQVGSSYIYATARDYARFALLYLNNGNFNNEQILPEDWVRYSTTATPDSRGKYGSSFWLNHSKQLPAAPENMYSCNGHDGQRIFIFPDRDAAVVILGYAPKNTNDMDFNALLADVLTAVP